MYRAIALAIAAIGTSGCDKMTRLRPDISAPAPSIDQEGRYRQDNALINILMKAYRQCQANGCSGSELKTKDAPIAEFLLAGITLSDIYCDRFFRNSNRSARGRRFARSTVNDVGGAMNVILGIAKAGSGISNGVGAGFAFGDNLFRNYEDSYMVDADLSKLQRLVYAAQDNMKIKFEDKPPKNIFAAETAILRYANICSFLGMQSMLNESVERKTTTIEDESKNIVADKQGEQTTPSPTPSVKADTATPLSVDFAPSAAPPPPPPGKPIP